MGHSVSLIKLVLKNLRLLNEANDTGLHYSAFSIGDKTHFEDTLQLVAFLKQQNLIDSDYDDSVGVWFLSEYGLQCHKEGHFETTEPLEEEKDIYFEEGEEEDEIEDVPQVFNLSDTISISSKQFTSIAKLLWILIFVIATLVILKNVYFPGKADLPFLEQEIENMKSSTKE